MRYYFEDKERIEKIEKLKFFQSINKGSYLKYSKYGAPYNTIELYHRNGTVMGKVESEYIFSHYEERSMISHRLTYNPDIANLNDD